MSKRLLGLILVTACLVVSPTWLRAQTILIWDPNGAVTGIGTAGGTWDTTTANWTNDSSGTAAPITWLNDGTVKPLITRSTIPETYAPPLGSSYTINVASAILTSGLDINLSVWDTRTVISFSGAGSLTLTDPTIALTAGTAAFNVPLLSTVGLLLPYVNYPGVLQLNTANPGLLGLTTVERGTLVYNHAGALGPETEGNGLTIGNGTLNFDTVSGGNFAYTLADPITITGTDSYKPRFSIAYDASSTRSVTLTGPMTLEADARFSGGLLYGTGSAQIIAAGIISGPSMNVRIDGDVALSGANTFTGRAIVALENSYSGNSRLTVPVFNDEGVAGPLGAGTGLVLGRDAGEGGPGGEIDYTGGTATSNRTIQIAGSEGTVGVNAPGSTLTLTGVISGWGGSVSHDFEKDGAGTLVLAGLNTYAGRTNIKEGTLALGADKALPTSTLLAVQAGATLNLMGFSATLRGLEGSGNVVLGAGTLTTGNNYSVFSGVISGTGGLTMSGDPYSQLTLTGANTYTGATTLEGGTLNLGDGGSTGSLNGATGTALRFNSGGTFNVYLAAGNTHMGLLTFSGGDSTVRSSYSLTSSTLTFADLAPRLAGATGNFVTSGGTNGTDHKIVLTNFAGSTTPTGALLSAGLFFGGASYAAYDPAGFLRAYTTTDSGFVAAPAGSTLGAVSAGSNAQMTGTITAQTTASVNTLQDTGAFNLTLAAGQTLSFSGLLKSGNNAATISGGAGLTSVNPGGEMIVRTDLASDLLTISTALLNNSANSLTKSGAGTLQLSGVNTYTGLTTVTGGTLRLSAVDALPHSALLSLGAGTLLEVDGNQTIAGFSGASGLSSSIQLATNATFTVALPVANAATAYAGSVNGGGTFAVTGAGGSVFNFTGSMGYTMGVSIGSGATLVVGPGGSIGGPIAVTGTLGLANLGSQSTLTGVISGPGGLLVSSGTTMLTGANVYTGPTLLNGGKLLVGNYSGSGTGTGTVTVNSGGTFGGYGFISGELVLNSGGTVAPGESPGTLSVGPTTFAGGAAFAFELNDAAGTAGNNWDLLSISGALTITATPNNPFILNLASLDWNNNPAVLANFNSSTPYTWQFVTATGGITGFTPGAFQYNASQFQNTLDGGYFSVSQAGNDLFLNFTPVPEPSTYALLGLGLGALALRLRRRAARVSPGHPAARAPVAKG